MNIIDKILKYIKTNDITAIQNLLKNYPNINRSEVNFLLRLTQHYEIKRIFDNTTSVKSISPEDIDFVKIDDDKRIDRHQNFKKNASVKKLPQPSNNNNIKLAPNHKISNKKMNLKTNDPNDILQDFSTKNPAVDKIMSMFYEAFKNNLSGCDLKQAASVSQEIAILIHKMNKISDKKFIASKKLNISNVKNKNLCSNVFNRTITAETFLNMTPEEMKSEELKKKEEQILQDYMCEIQAPKLKAETTIFKCGKCGERKTTYYQMQTRSADEPMTNFVTCVVCGNRWKFS